MIWLDASSLQPLTQVNVMRRKRENDSDREPVFSTARFCRDAKSGRITYAFGIELVGQRESVPVQIENEGC
jgi:hypothetical protein